jgi:hypothetical protein
MTMPAGKVEFRAETSAAAGQSLEWIRNGIVIGKAAIGTDADRFSTRGSPGDWFSVVMRDRQDEPTPMLTAFAAVPPHISIDEINAGDAWARRHHNA